MVWIAVACCSIDYVDSAGGVVQGVDCSGLLHLWFCWLETTAMMPQHFSPPTTKQQHSFNQVIIVYNKQNFTHTSWQCQYYYPKTCWNKSCNCLHHFEKIPEISPSILPHSPIQLSFYAPPFSVLEFTPILPHYPKKISFLCFSHSSF